MQGRDISNGLFLLLSPQAEVNIKKIKGKYHLYDNESMKYINAASGEISEMLDVHYNSAYGWITK